MLSLNHMIASEVWATPIGNRQYSRLPVGATGELRSVAIVFQRKHWVFNNRQLESGLGSWTIKHGNGILHQLHFRKRKQKGQCGFSALVAVDAIDMQSIVATAGR